MTPSKVNIREQATTVKAVKHLHSPAPPLLHFLERNRTPADSINYSHSPDPATGSIADRSYEHANLYNEAYREDELPLPHSDYSETPRVAALPHSELVQ